MLVVIFNGCVYILRGDNSHFSGSGCICHSCVHGCYVGFSYNPMKCPDMENVTTIAPNLWKMSPPH